eukprot:2783090-Prymnesium_polylepis.2
MRVDREQGFENLLTRSPGTLQSPPNPPTRDAVAGHGAVSCLYERRAERRAELKFCKLSGLGSFCARVSVATRKGKPGAARSAGEHGSRRVSS